MSGQTHLANMLMDVQERITKLEAELAEKNERIATLEAALRWAVTELQAAPAFTDDEVSRPPPEVEATIRALSPPEQGGEKL